MSKEKSTLDRLAELTMIKNTSNLTRFDNIIGVHIGCEYTPHYPKLRDQKGQKLQDENGRDLRSEKSDGYTYTFVEFSTAKTVKIVLPKAYNLDLLGVYKLSGNGYDIKSSRILFIEQNGTITNF